MWKNVIRVGKNASSCGKKVENWRKNKIHDQYTGVQTVADRVAHGENDIH